MATESSSVRGEYQRAGPHSAHAGIALGLGGRGPAIPTEWISKQGFGMQGATPVTVPPHPRRRIGCLDRERLSFYGQSLFDFVGDDCDVLAQYAHLDVA